MALRAGRAATWLARRGRAMNTTWQTSSLTANNKIIGGVLGVSAGAGVISAARDSEGPWGGRIMPQVQDALLGDPQAVRNMAKASIAAQFVDSSEDVHLPPDTMYGRPINPRAIAKQNRNQPVPGEVVFGAYNLRRGQ